jgi:hypothetical protein
MQAGGFCKCKLLQINPRLSEIVAEQVVHLAEDLEDERHIAHRWKQYLQLAEGYTLLVGQHRMVDNLDEFLVEVNPYFLPFLDAFPKLHRTIDNPHDILCEIIRIEYILVLRAKPLK